MANETIRGVRTPLRAQTAVSKYPASNKLYRMPERIVTGPGISCQVPVQ